MKFVVPLIQAVKEQQDLIVDQKNKIATLEDRLQRLEQLFVAHAN